MPATAQTPSKVGLTIDREAHTIRLVRDISAPPARIFEAWTQPDQVAAWWDPSGKRLTDCTIDLRPGGAFRFVSQDHPEMPFAGTYSAIEPPHRLEFEAMASTGRVLLQAAGDGTHMVVEIQCATGEQLAQFIEIGVDAGTAQTLDNLAAFAGRGAQPRAPA